MALVINIDGEVIPQRRIKLRRRPLPDNIRRHKVFTWMLMNYKDDDGRLYSDVEIAKNLRVDLKTFNADRQIVLKEFDNIFSSGRASSRSSKLEPPDDDGF